MLKIILATQSMAWSMDHPMKEMFDYLKTNLVYYTHPHCIHFPRAYSGNWKQDLGKCKNSKTRCVKCRFKPLLKIRHFWPVIKWFYIQNRRYFNHKKQMCPFFFGSPLQLSYNLPRPPHQQPRCDQHLSPSWRQPVGCWHILHPEGGGRRAEIKKAELFNNNNFLFCFIKWFCRG